MRDVRMCGPSVNRRSGDDVSECHGGPPLYSSEATVDWMRGVRPLALALSAVGGCINAKPLLAPIKIRMAETWS